MPVSAHSNLKSNTLALLKQYAQTPSLDLRNQIVETNLGLVRREAQRFSAQYPDAYDDLVQVGTLGLIRSIDRFDVAKGFAFSSFALPYVRGDIQHYLRDHHATVRLPRRWYRINGQAPTAIARLQDELQRPPTDAEIARALNVSLMDWQQAKLAKRNQTLLSLDAPAHAGEGADATDSLGDVLPDQPYRSFELAPSDRLWLQMALHQLEHRTRDIVEAVFLQDLTQQETARQLGISSVTVARRLKRGLAQLRQSLNDDERSSPD